MGECMPGKMGDVESAHWAFKLQNVVVLQGMVDLRHTFIAWTIDRALVVAGKRCATADVIRVMMGEQDGAQAQVARIQRVPQWTLGAGIDDNGCAEVVVQNPKIVIVKRRNADDCQVIGQWRREGIGSFNCSHEFNLYHNQTLTPWAAG